MQNCLLCNRPLRQKLTIEFVLSWAAMKTAVICSNCQASFEKITAQHCPTCGRQSDKVLVCPDCQRWQQTEPLVFKNRALYNYNSAMQDYFANYKFRGDYRLRAVFQTVVQQAVLEFSVDQIVPIPVSQQTMKSRGFNQVSGWLPDIKYSAAIAVKQVAKQRQSKFDRRQRLASNQLFRLAVPAGKIVGQRFLIVDDVYTTGRTIRHAVRLLLENGAKSVRGLTLAR